MSRRRIVVTGATGFIGQHLVSRLFEDGERVCILTRNPEKVPFEWKKRLAILKGDLLDKDFSLPDNADVVFHCAGEIKDKDKFEKTNVEGTKNIVRACLEHGHCKLVYLSSVGVMGSEKPGVVDETEPCSPKNMYEKTKYEAERVIHEAIKNFGLNAVLLRPSIVYGPGIAKGRDSFLALIQAIKRGRFCVFGKEPSYYNIVYVGDVVEALIFLAQADVKASGGVFIINDAISWQCFSEEVLAILKMRGLVFKMPKIVGYVLVLVCEAGRRIGIKMPFSLSRYRAIACKTIFSSERLLKQRGFKFRYGNTEGIRSTLEHYLSQGLL